MQLNIFFIISTLLIVKPTVNGLFLSEIGIEWLPLAFVLVAIFAALISTLYTRFLGRLSLHRIILTTLLISVALFVLFGLLLRLNVVGGWILFAFYLWVSIFAVLSASQFWVLANVVFNAREAKRLFGFIGSGAIAGGIFGGYLTTLLAERVGSENLILIAAGLLAICIPLTTAVWHRQVLPGQSKFQRRKKINKTEHPFHLIQKSPHLVNLAGIIGVSVIVAKLVDYQFSAIAAAKITDPDELTAFFGFWFSNFNVMSLLVQLLLTRRVVGTLGVGSSLLFLPIGVLIGAIAVLFAPELWAAVFVKMNDGSLKQSINKAAVELLALPVPAQIKNQTKTFIDVVVDSLATGISGLILIFLVHGLELSARMISIMIIAFIAGWLYFAFRVKKTYLNSFQFNIQSVSQKGEDRLDLSNESVISDLRAVLRKGGEGQILFVLKKLNRQPDNRFAPDFLHLLKHSSDKVKESALRNLYFVSGQHFIEEVRLFITYPSQQVKIAAFDYLIAHAKEDAALFMEAYLNDTDYKIKLAALVSLAEESRDNLMLKERFDLEKRLQQLQEQLSAISPQGRRDFHKEGLLRALGMAKIPALFPMIESFFYDDNPKVAGQAILAAGQTMHPYFLPMLIQFLKDPKKSEPVLQALIAYGPEVVNYLSEYMKSTPRQKEVWRVLPAVFGAFGNQQSADLLFELLKDPDSGIRLAALRSLNQLKSRHNYLNFHTKRVIQYLLQEIHLFQDTLSILYVQNQIVNHRTENEGVRLLDKFDHRRHLIQLLEARLDNNLESIFRLLGLKYPPDHILSLYESLQSQQADLRFNAIEYLDNLLDSGLKKILIPIVENALIDMASEETIRKMKLKLPAEAECYQLLLSGDDEDIKAAVRSLME